MATQFDETIHQFNKTTCRIVSDAAVEALQEVAKRFGLTIGRKAGSYTDLTFKVGIEFRAVAKDGTDAEQATFNQYCGMFGLEPSDFGQRFVANNEVWAFAGLRMKRSKYPILARNVLTGKQTLFTQDVVDRYHAQQKLPAHAKPGSPAPEGK